MQRDGTEQRDAVVVADEPELAIPAADEVIAGIEEGIGDGPFVDDGNGRGLAEPGSGGAAHGGESGNSAPLFHRRRPP